METRDIVLLKMRPEISSKIYSSISADEYFQNTTLRPVIKLQNDLLVEAFKNYIVKNKNIFPNLNIDKKLEFIENAVQKDMKFRNSLKGMIIGQFTIDEYKIYIKNSSALNKRMMNLVKERLKDNMLQFDPEITKVV